MALRTLTILSIISLSCLGADYQIANRAGLYDVRTSTMLTSTWTNSVLWLTADSPILNEGTTNATWLDFSPEHNDATQTDTDKQPDRVYTNGAWAWEFDGVDDSVVAPIYPVGGTTFEIRFRLKTIKKCAIVGVNDGANHRFYLIVHKDGYYFQFGYGAAFQVTTKAIDTSWHVAELRSNKKAYIDGVEYADFSSSSFSGTSANALGIGEISSSGGWGFANVEIDYVKVWMP